MTPQDGFGKEAKDLLQEMESKGVVPTTDFFSSVVVAICKRNDIIQTFEVSTSMRILMV